MIRKLHALFTIALVLAACSDPTGPDDQRVKGIIFWSSATSLATGAGHLAAAPVPPTDGEIEVIQAPDQVVAGEGFTATITTIGADGCWRSDGATVEVEALTAEITPWDRAPTTDDEACATVLVALEREVSLRFDEPGQAVIRVFGRKVVNGDLDGAEEEIAEKVVQVVAPGSP